MKADSELPAIYDATGEHWHDRLGLLGYPRAYEDLFDRYWPTEGCALCRTVGA